MASDQEMQFCCSVSQIDLFCDVLVPLRTSQYEQPFKEFQALNV